MTVVGTQEAGSWIDDNAPHNGEFKCYYTKLSKEQEDAGTGVVGPNTNSWVQEKLKENRILYEKGLLGEDWNSFHSLEPNGYQLRYHWNYINGKKHGVARSWWSNGQLRRECTYNMGEYVGPDFEWFRDGQIREKKYYDDNGGLTDTRYQYYHEGHDGNLKWEKEYKNGQQHGNVNFYYKDGVLRMNGQYEKNKPVGIWSYHYTHDNFETLTTYDGKVFDGTMNDGYYLYWSEEEEDFINNQGWERTERQCSSWIEIRNGKIIEEVKFEHDTFDGTFDINVSSDEWDSRIHDYKTKVTGLAKSNEE